MGKLNARKSAARQRERSKRGHIDTLHDVLDPRDVDYLPSDSEDEPATPAEGKRNCRAPNASVPPTVADDANTSDSDQQSDDEDDGTDEEPCSDIEEIDRDAWRLATRLRYPTFSQSLVQSTLLGKRLADNEAAGPPHKVQHVDPMARSKVYLGTSATTQWRNRDKAAERAAHAKKFRNIGEFFTKKPRDSQPPSNRVDTSTSEDVMEISAAEFHDSVAPVPESLRSVSSEDMDIDPLNVPQVHVDQLLLSTREELPLPHDSAASAVESDSDTAADMIEQLAACFAQLTVTLPADIDHVLASFQSLAVSPEACATATSLSSPAEQSSTGRDATHPTTSAAILPVTDTEPPPAHGPHNASQFERMSCRLRLALSQAQKSKDVQLALDLRILSEFNILRERYRRDGRSDPSGAAALQIAATQPGYKRAGESFTRGPSFARTVQRRAAYFLEHGSLPPSTQGRGAKHASLLDLPGMQQRIETHISELGIGKINPRRLCRFVNETALPELAPGKKISLKCAARWLKKLGYFQETFKKGVYVDGHDRPDNVLSRQGLYLPQMLVHESFCVKYDDKTDAPLPPSLPDDAKRRHIVFHDECYFNANDRENIIWVKQGQQQLRQKGRGRGVHVSGFIYEEGGFLKLDPEQLTEHNARPAALRLKSTDSTVIIHPGKNADPWWDMKQLQKQLSTSLDIFEYLHPEDQAVFVFDQSTAHGAFSDDALVAARMNVGPGGKQPRMHDTRIPMDNPHQSLRGKSQCMALPDGTPKGMEAILKERRLYDLVRKGKMGKPVGKCSTCSASETKRMELEKRAREALEADPELYGSLNNAISVLSSGPDTADGTATAAQSEWCCMQRCLSLQRDFLEEKPQIQLYIESRGHFCMFLPKFHCELNPIELVWSNAKQQFRLEADGTFQKAKELVPACLASIPARTIRHYFRKVYRYMDAYRKGLSSQQAVYAVKKYKSHRAVPANVMEEFNLPPTASVTG